MTDWRGRRRGPANFRLLLGALLCTVLVSGCSSPTGGTAAAAQWQLVISDGQGVVLRVPLPEGVFTLRYRNSVYGSLAEERFRVADGGVLELIELAADEAAVLDEYYMTGDRPRPAAAGDTRRWRAAPASPLSLRELRLLATEHGERTLLVGQTTVALWQLSDESSALMLVAERTG
ncbi:MAG TPA: hypothetical protein VMP67_09685 [Candidatus Limnocylindria bacterium]|nr:hypothetical protein [Candidatus Limnocylindria bacterium]